MAGGRSGEALPPARVTRPGVTWDRFTAGQAHACALSTDGTAYCWGDNTFGQLGDGTVTERDTPVAVAGGLRISRISAGADHTCGVTPAGGAYCRGDNNAGQLADRTGTDRKSTRLNSTHSQISQAH